MSDEEHGPAADAGAPADESGRDHYTLAPLGWLAGCSDIGRRHRTNQDALALAGRELERGRTAVLVISDGVSTSPGSETSAAIAAEVTCSTLTAMLRGETHPGPEQIAASITDACAAANDAVCSAPSPTGVPGSCTLIAAVIGEGRITVGNVGDCRAYWIGDEGEPRVLSVDDSVAQARIEMGMSREEAENGYQAHAITRWLGPDSRDWSPRQVSMEVTGDGWLVLCSDGLWNYCSPAQEMNALVHEAAAQCGQEAATTAQLLAAWANEQGGRDNITVALARVTATPRGAAQAATEQPGVAMDDTVQDDAGQADGAPRDATP